MHTILTDYKKKTIKRSNVTNGKSITTCNHILHVRLIAFSHCHAPYQTRLNVATLCKILRCIAVNQVPSASKLTIRISKFVTKSLHQHQLAV